MSIDKFFFRIYNRKTYNCAHLACEVWKHLTGEDLSKQMQGFFAGRGETKAVLKDLRGFVRLPKPVSPCIVLLQAPRLAPHVGIFLKGRVIHIQPRGVEFQPIEIVSNNFTKVGFYKWQPNE